MSAPTFSSFRRRLRLGIAGLILSGLGMVGTMIFTGLESPLGGDVFIGAVLLGWASVAFLFFGVRCPRCRARLFATSAATQPYGSMMPSVTGLQRCPKCGLED